MKTIKADKNKFDCALEVLDKHCSDLYRYYFNGRKCGLENSAVNNETVCCDRCVFKNKEFIRGWLRKED